MQHIGVLGAGTMGHGIAQVCAMAGYSVRLFDSDPAGLQRGLDKVRSNLDKGVERGKVSPEAAEKAVMHLHGATSLQAAAEGADLVIEAVPEILDLKRELFGKVAAVAPDHCILGTNTSSLSVGAIAEGLPHPEQVIGTHFFNPVHIMKLLEVIVADVTSDATLAAVRQLGERIGKDVIVVRDVPGFATSRLGVALGMEAIRMVESGVASAEDIDKAMVLGYRHPVGPLKLTDMVGLDVRMHIGEYLARELGNAAFEPPALMRQMVAEGRLGRKSGQGFYDWSKE